MIALLLDDQPHVLGGMMLGIHWEKCGITRILKATSAAEARARITATHVDILLCDIEMPTENGLSFIQWLRDNHYDTACIVLTAHANFDYARRALQLGSIDYILQPAPYEKVEEVLCAAVEHIKQRREEQRYSSYGQLMWNKHEQLYQMCIDDWFFGRSAQWDALPEDLQRLDVHITDRTPLLCAVCRFEKASGNNRILLDSTLTELTDGGAEDKFLVATEDNQLFRIVLYSADEQGERTDVQRQQLAQMAPSLRLSCGLSVEIGIAPAGCTHRQVPDVMEDLCGALPEEDAKPAPAVSMPDASAAPLLLCQHVLTQLRDAPDMSDEAFHQLYLDFLQSLSASFHRQGLSLRMAMGENIDRLMNAYHSPANFVACVEQVAAELERATKQPEDAQEQLGAITEYIYQNIEKDLRRSDVAAAVYLSPSYLSRFFREHMSMTLKDYIIQEKMKLAHTLLVTTTLPISVIATKIGYTNFSYFSQTYKKTWGVSPSAERES